MATVLDDVTDRNIDAAYLRRRVDDWARRVASLFDELTDGLPEGWEVTAAITMSMHEELMRKFNVPPQARERRRLNRLRQCAKFDASC